MSEKQTGIKKLENILYLTEGYLQLDNNTTARHILYFTPGVLKCFGQGPLDLL
jgi:hypothetical protein